MQQAAGGVTRRDIFRALLPYCANHPRSVFALKTVNRLVLSGSQFKQSTADSLTAALAPFDAFLAVLIHHLDFDESRALPESSQLAGITHLTPAVQYRLIVSLAQLGLIQNERGGYVLAEDFEWPRRFQLLHKAYAQWNERIALRPADRAGLAPTIALQLNGNSGPEAYVHLEAAPAATSEAPQYIRPVVVDPVITPIKAEPDVEDGQETPKAPVAGAAMLRATAALSDIQLRQAANRADTIFYELLLLIAKQGPALNYSSITAVATVLAKSTKHSIQLVARVLKGREPGAPLLFHLYPADGDCVARLLPISDDEWGRLPRTKRALNLLGDDVKAGLEDPANWFIEPADERKPVRAAPEDEATRREREKLILANQRTTADTVFEAVAHRITRETTTLPYSRINELAIDIAKAAKTTKATVIDVLSGRYKGLPRVFEFKFVTVGTKHSCHVTLAQPSKLGDWLPKTKLALQQFQANRDSAKVEARKIAEAQRLVNTAAKAARAEKAAMVLAAKAEAKTARAAAAIEATKAKALREEAEHDEPSSHMLSKPSQIMLNRTLRKQIETKNANGRPHKVQVTVRKKRVLVKRRMSDTNGQP